MSNIAKVREHLFDVIDGLKSKEAPMEIERAKVICDVAQTIINSAKVEVDFLRATDGDLTRSTFLGAPSDTTTLPDGITSIRQHRIAG